MLNAEPAQGGAGLAMPNYCLYHRQNSVYHGHHQHCTRYEIRKMSNWYLMLVESQQQQAFKAETSDLTFDEDGPDIQQGPYRIPNNLYILA